MEYKITVYKLNHYLKGLRETGFPTDKIGDNLSSVLKMTYDTRETKIILSMLLFYLDYCKWNYDEEYRKDFLNPTLEALTKYVKELV